MSPSRPPLKDVDWAQAAASIPVRSALFTGENELVAALTPAHFALPRVAEQEASDLHDEGDASPVRRLLSTRRTLVLAGVIAAVAIAGAVGASLRVVWPGDSRSTVIDNFSRSDASTLGTSDSGATWRIAGGVWGVENHAARVARADKSGPAFAVVDTGSADGTVRITMAAVSTGAGLVFRYVDPGNYWAVQAAPSYGTWAIRKYVNGKLAFSTNAGLVSSRPGVAVTVTLKGSAVALFIDGVRRHTVVDDSFTGSTRFGLTATGAQPAARWTEFRASPTIETPTPPTTLARR